MKSLSIFVGTGVCNARCQHCAGVPLRAAAPKRDGEGDWDLVARTLEEGYESGARYLSLSSSGEPTLSPRSVTRALQLVYHMRLNGKPWEQVNLYTNGLRIGCDPIFNALYLPVWRSLGLSWLYLTVHSTDSEKNAEAYGVREYPHLAQVVNHAHYGGLKVRANLVLTLDSLRDFTDTVYALKELKFDGISAWPIRDPETDQVDTTLAPSVEQLRTWQEFCDVTGVNLHTGENKEYDTGDKRTLFPDGCLSSTWCNR